MRNRTGIVLSAVLVLTAAAVVNTEADSLKPRMHRLPVDGFGVSGEFTGTLNGTIQMGTDTFLLSPDVIVYEIGTGMLPQGTIVTDRYVYLSGSQAGMINMVIIRPASESGPDPSDPENHVHVLSNAKPQ